MGEVDVVIPCYNYARYLEQCVESIVEQEGVRTRLLIIDDASTDDTPDTARELTNRYHNVSYRRHEANWGHIETYNEGLLSWASAEYSLLISADDYLAPGSLMRAIELMRSDQQMQMCFGLTVEFTDDCLEPVLESTSRSRVLSGPELIRMLCLRGNPVPTPSALVKTETQKAVGGYDANLPHSGDMEMWLRFALRGNVGFIGQIQAFKRAHALNMNISYALKPIGDLKEQLQAIESLNCHVEEHPFLEDLISEGKRRIAEHALWMGVSKFDAGDIKNAEECLAFAETLEPGVLADDRFKRVRLRARFPNLWRYSIAPLKRRFEGPRREDNRGCRVIGTI